MDFKDAKLKILEILNSDFGLDVELMTDQIIPKPYGWVVFYNSRAFIETGNVDDALMSNTPFVFTNEGAIHYLRVTGTTDEAIKAVEETYGLVREPGSLRG